MSAVYMDKGGSMDKRTKFIFATLVIVLFSQLYMNFYISDFKFSFAAVFFPVFLYIYDELNPLAFGFSSGVAFFIVRTLVGQGIVAVIPEALFYIFYGFVFLVYKYNKGSYSLTNFFFLIFCTDFLGNTLEIYIRLGNDIFRGDIFIFQGILTAAISRAVIAFIIIVFLKYYRMFLIKEEHEERYKKLLLFISRLKTEVYWLEKNMDNIERVMSNVYQLSLNISEEKNSEFKEEVLKIAKDIHEIKKDYGLVVQGLETILDDRISTEQMSFKELTKILQESLKFQCQAVAKNIDLEFKSGEDFNTDKHFILLSILRNLIMNSIESISSNGTITLIHQVKREKHSFIVKDNGCGISQEDLPHIFNPGYSSKINYYTGEVNRGLGLSLVKSLIEEQFEGQINVNSRENEGTCFEILIPIHKLEVE
ncbi:sensor histidine kinase [Natranaerobius trueperi]|uniref:histidine kinase n=1 Tax=Natranaerobius trueperi TaxID=759412 RepID=A0A226BVE5_9FIRM|nr:ATP-binding protein [Natranaerobius trueperi]OWZ82851.1 ATP-binding protein [Natranaerobius trueperi]